MADIDAAKRADVESFVTDWMSEADVPGAALAVVEGDELVYAEGFGARDLESNAPATPDTLFGIGSCTKSFTTLAVMQLVADGKLAVDDPVSDYVDHFGDVDGDDVTVGDLMTHSSGMPSDGSAVVLIQRLMGVDPTEVPLSDAGDFRRHVAGASDDRVTDRESFFYYNSGFTVLGELVEAVSGQSFREYVDENVHAPLGMSRSTFSRADFDADADAMTPYYPGEDGSEEGPFPFDHNIDAPGGMVSSVTEMSRYLRAQMNGGSFDGADLLDSELVAEMHEPRSTRREFVDGATQRYGYGWMIQELLGERLVHHGGSVGVSTAWVGFLEESNRGAVLLCNTTADPHPMHVGPAILSLLAGESPEEDRVFALRSKTAPLVGEYESYRGLMSATVERAEGGLSLELGNERGKRDMRLFPESLDADEKEFYTVTNAGERSPVRFEKTDDGWDVFVERWRLHSV